LETRREILLEIDFWLGRQEDFVEAVKRVQPSSKREGFATVPDVTWDEVPSFFRERVLYGLNPLNHRDELSGPALRHGSLNSLFQVALYLPSSFLLYILLGYSRIFLKPVADYVSPTP
jgi:hypothetical protein